MKRYSVQPRDQIFRNGYGFLSFARNMGKNISKKYNLIEYSDTYSKTSESLWQYYRDEPALDNNNSNSISFKLKQQITGQTGNRHTKDLEIMVPLKYLRNFWKKLEMSLINCEISLQLMV